VASQHRKVIYTKRSEICTSQTTDEKSENVHFVEIAQPGFYMKPCPGGWLDNSMPIKKGDPGRPVISIQIGQQQFNEVICDIGSSFNIIPKVIYDDVLQFGPLLQTTMRLRFADRSTVCASGIHMCLQIL